MAIIPITLTAKTEAEQTEIAEAIASNNGLSISAAAVKQNIIEHLQKEVNLFKERNVKKEKLGIE